MKVPASAHTAHPWRIRELTPDFRIEDVWEIPAPGCADDLQNAVAVVTALDPARSKVWAVRALFALRWKLGALLGWDRVEDGIGPRVTSLAQRLPPDLLAAA